MDAEKKQIPDNQLLDNIYKARLLNWNFIILGIIFLIIGFTVNLPIKEKITDLITSKMASNESCPIFFERLEVGNYLETINISGPIISGTCLGRQGSLRFDKIVANLSWPNLFPPGLQMNIQLTDDKSTINFHPVISYPKILVSIDQTTLEGAFLEKLMGGTIKILGKFKIDSLIEMENGDLLEGDLKIISDSFMIPRQTISGFNTPSLLLRNFGINGTITEKNIIDFSSIIIGDKDSIIFTQMNGKLRLNKAQFGESAMELSGKIRFSKTFINNFPILNLLLSGKTPGPDGMYNIKLQGPLSSLKPSIF
jgi:hypothetical protein